MAKKKYKIGEYTFDTKIKLRDFIRDLVSRYDDEERLNEVDCNFVLDLVERHPQADTKIGPGIDHIIIRRNPVYRQTRGLHLFRVDGSDTDISWTECLRPTPHDKKIISAMRVLVEPQTIAFKQRFFDTQEPICELTGERIEFVGSHVDHIPPHTFEQIVLDFCEAHSVNLGNVSLRDETADNRYTDTIDDDILADQWQEYHQCHARLRVVSQYANLSISKYEQRETQ